MACIMFKKIRNKVVIPLFWIIYFVTRFNALDGLRYVYFMHVLEYGVSLA